MTRKHRAEAFIEDPFLSNVRKIGWQCFTCGQEETGFPNITEALSAANAHEQSGDDQ